MAGWLLALLWAAPVAAYQREDHAATVRLALRASEPGFAGAETVAACAQLPDEAPELSAIDVYKRLMRHPFDYARWAAGGGPAATAGRMVAVQELLHGLTGGSSAGVRAVAARVVAEARARAEAVPTGDAQARADALCALGFAYHLYGDSFAHARLRNAERMYPPGVGHLFDGTRPDLPLVSRARLGLFQTYLSSVALLAPGARAPDFSGLFAGAEKPAAEARERNGFSEPALRELLARTLAAAGAVEALTPFDRGRRMEGCQALADRQAAAAGAGPAPRCEQAWRLYRALAEPAFDDYDAAHPQAPSREPLRAGRFTGSPFSGGTRW